LILNSKDDSLDDLSSDPKDIKNTILNGLKRNYKNTKSPITEVGNEFGFNFDKDEDHEEITLAEFIEIFVDMKTDFISAKEAMIIFDDINKTKGDALTQARPKILSSKIYAYFTEGKTEKPRGKSKEKKEDKSDKKKDEKKSFTKKNESVFHAIENDTGIKLPMLFNRFEKDVKLSKVRLIERINQLYKKSDIEIDDKGRN